MQQQRRKAPAGNGTRYDLARKRKQQPGTFDHQQWPEILLWNVRQPEHAGVIEIECEQDIAGQFSLALELQFDLEIAGGDLSRIDVDLDADLGLLLLLHQGLRGIRIFKRKVLDVLRHDAEV